jgi:hypothetical protein
MRAFSSNVKNLIDRDDLSIFTLVRIETEPYLQYTTLPYDVTVSGMGTFDSDNGLVSVEPPRVTSVVDRSSYKLTLTDPDMSFRERFEAGMVGTHITVWIGFINTTDTTLGGIAPGKPITNVEDIVLAYRGVVDTHGYNITEDQCTLALECSSPMADLGLVKTFYTSRDAVRQRGYMDTAFDQVYSGSKGLDLLWGRA